MLWSWRAWHLPHVRWIWLAVYGVLALASLALGTGIATALAAALAAFVVVGVLEFVYRRRHPSGMSNTTRGGDTGT